MKVQNDILTNKKKRLVTLLVLLDLSAAFDTVDPSILLTRLRSKLGLNGTALSWFCSYLSGRTQRISVQGALSNVFHLRYGVPKGSCLGPVLFNIQYIQAKSSTLSVVTFQKFIVTQMTPSFIYRSTQAVLLVKTKQLDQWKPVSRMLSSG